MIDAINDLRERFVERLQAKTGWGRNQLINEFDILVTEMMKEGAFGGKIKGGSIADDVYASLTITVDKSGVHIANIAKNGNDLPWA